MKLVVFGLIGFFAFSASVYAESHTWVEARVSSASGCSYFSRIDLEMRATLEDKSLPWGTQVELVSGEKISSWHQPQSFLDWQNQNTVQARAVSPYTWQANRVFTYAERSSPLFLVGVQFVWKITLPDGQLRYEKGTLSPMGYYEVNVDHITASCKPLEETPWLRLK